MNEEQLHDALGSLSEDLLAPVDALRRRKHRPWVRWCATAACLCLVVGAAFRFQTVRFLANSESSQSEDILSTTAYSSATKRQEAFSETSVFLATVLEVHETVILVAPDSGSLERSCSDKIEVVIRKPDEIPVLNPGDRVKIVYDGTLRETYPAQAGTVFRIEKVDLP